MSIEQRVFELWVGIELLLISSYICCTSFYILVCKIQKPDLELLSPLTIAEDCNIGFMPAHSLLRSVFNVIFSSAFICAILLSSSHIELSGNFRSVMWINMILHIIQFSTFILAIFPTSVSQRESELWLKTAPLAIFYCSQIAFHVMPIVIMLFNVIVWASKGHEMESIKSLLCLNIIT